MPYKMTINTEEMELIIEELTTAEDLALYLKMKRGEAIANFLEKVKK